MDKGTRTETVIAKLTSTIKNGSSIKEIATGAERLVWVLKKDHPHIDTSKLEELLEGMTNLEEKIKG